ncbi:MAG: MFS transporter [Actinomycetales bacterium]|nr:MFS transporter [Candidatus Phosphoribacter baldrii]
MLGSLGIWTLIVTVAFFVPAKSLVLFLALAFFIGMVLGGSQALSRSLYNQLIPARQGGGVFQPLSSDGTRHELIPAQ